MASQRSVNTNLTADAHFSVSYTGSAWVAVNYPAISNLPWSLVCLIDLRMRPDGFINSAPVASIISPQYAVVNRTTQITIPVSDADVGDDVRCRWAVYIAGSGRRKRSDEEKEQQYIKQNYVSSIYKKQHKDEETIHSRKKRGNCRGCQSTCVQYSLCCCPACAGTTCTGWTCTTSGGCAAVAVTIEAQGTTLSTSSYPITQPIDECGGICYPSSVPTGTTLSNCTVSFLGLVPNVWYGVAVQVRRLISAGTNIMSIYTFHCNRSKILSMIPVLLQ
jgi:hypothetical protein